MQLIKLLLATVAGAARVVPNAAPSVSPPPTGSNVTVWVSVQLMLQWSVSFAVGVFCGWKRCHVFSFHLCVFSPLPACSEGMERALCPVSAVCSEGREGFLVQRHLLFAILKESNNFLSSIFIHSFAYWFLFRTLSYTTTGAFSYVVNKKKHYLYPLEDATEKYDRKWRI